MTDSASPSTGPEDFDRVLAEPERIDPLSGPTIEIATAQDLAIACRRMRRQAGCSQRAFAARADVSKTTIERIETCEVDPAVGLVARLASTAGVQLAVTGLDPTSFLFSIVDDQRDGAGRHAPPHRLSPAGTGWWDPSLRRPIREAVFAHRADMVLLMSTAAARSKRRR
jgi:transcriptional regulator with XRE-family HTH domain